MTMARHSLLVVSPIIGLLVFYSIYPFILMGHSPFRIEIEIRHDETDWNDWNDHLASILTLSAMQS